MGTAMSAGQQLHNDRLTGVLSPVRLYKSPEEPAMPDFDAAFDALEHLDNEARRAVELSGAMYEELYLDVVARANKAEWLLERVHNWASQWGLIFDLKTASDHWDAHKSCAG
jgi:hypothetical protein